MRVRKGYVIVGWCKSFRHWKTGRIVFAPPGKSFPIWRKLDKAA